MVFNIREVVEFDRGGRAFCPSCQLKKGRRPSQRSLAVLPSGAYKCHAGCTPDEIRHAVGQPREQGARICARPVVKLDPPPAKAATVYTQSELKEGTELLLEGKGSPMVAAREWLFQRGFTPEMIRHWGLCFHSRPLGIGIPIPVDESGERFYLKTRRRPWKNKITEPPWIQTGIPAMVFFTYRSETASQTFLCEGEWDAMMLGWLMIQANVADTAVATFTCGCRSIPQPLQLKRLIGPVFIFYDRDLVGREGAEKLKDALGSQAHIAQVPMPEDLGEVPKGWDISDAINHGLSLQQIQEAAASALPPDEPDPFKSLIDHLGQVFSIEAASERAFALEVLSRQIRIQPSRLQQIWLNHLVGEDRSDPLEVHQFISTSPERREFIIPGLIPRGTVIIMVADGGLGKTLVALDLCRAIALGQPWNGKPVLKGRVLIIQSDEPAVECAVRLREANFEQVDPGQVLVKTEWQFVQLPLLKRWIQAFQPMLVMIDSLTATNRHSEFEEKDIAYGMVLYELRDLANRFGTTFLVLHHTNKLGIERGTTAIRNNVGEVWLLKHKNRHDPQNKEREWIIDKSRSGCNDSFLIELDEEDYSWILKPKDSSEGKTPMEDRVLEWFQQDPQVPREIEEVAREFGTSSSTARRALKKLWRMGFLQEQALKTSNNNGRGGKTTKKIYLYPYPDLKSDQKSLPEPTLVTGQCQPQREQRPGSPSGAESCHLPLQGVEIGDLPYDPERPF